MQGYALADRQIEVGLCLLAVPVLSRHGQVVAALNVSWAATVSAAALKEKARPATAARRWTCRYSYSAVCGFVTVARLRQIPAASSRSMTPAVASTRLCAWVRPPSPPPSAPPPPRRVAPGQADRLADR